jgi:protein involved in polysaccharide export with SLBB domain
LLVSVLGGNHLAAQETKPEAANPTGQTNTTVPLPADPAALFDPARTNVPGTVSVHLPPQLADWQKRLTLGPGDVLNISLYDQPESARSLFIGPDGRLNYLQARDVEASGLTIDELRTKLEEILTKFYLSPRLIVLPEAYRSKKYIILGNVNQKGVFLLDRPTSIIEAVARAKGFETSYLQRNALVTADLSRSFLVRQDEADTFKQIPVDFEALFLRGDLGQNIGLVPGDYLYFPPLDVPEVYILGDVRSPGLIAYSPDLTVLRAVITRGGFTPKAYRKKILVIRGSFNYPQTFVVDASGVLSAKNPDFLLKARDIVYVPSKPWAYAQELLDAAVMEYMRAVVVTWTGQNIGPFTKQPFVPNIK